MEFNWEYPLYVVRHEGGFASVAVDTSHTADRFALAVFTSRQTAQRFTELAAIEGTIESLDDERSFARLAAGLRAPFTEIVFDAAPVASETNARWQVSVATILADHLVLARSPWDYPVFVLEQRAGLAAIDGQPTSAIALFTDLDRLAEYQQSAEIAGISRAIPRPEPLAELLRSLPDRFEAVAVNPTFRDGVHVAKHCIPVRTLFEKYLPGASAAEDERSS